jgi:predicted nucleic acid-binding protein
VIFIDSNIVIYAIGDATERGDRVRRRLADRETSFAVNDAVMMEARVKPMREDDLLTLRRLDRFFDEVTRLSIPPAVYEQATRLRAHHGLKALDAIHVATAQFHLCEGFWTHDSRLARAAGGLEIEIV